MALSTVTAVLARLGVQRLSRLAPPEPPNRYERRHPGELLHIDVKKLGKIGRPGHRVNGDRRTRSRGIGWEYVHIAIDDATRLAYVRSVDPRRPEPRLPWGPNRLRSSEGRCRTSPSLLDRSCKV